MHFGLAVGCDGDVDHQEEGGGMKVEGGHQRRPLVWCEDNKVSLLVSLLLFFLLVWPLVVLKEEGDEERKRKVKKREHERGYRRDTNTQEILSSLLMFCFFALCFVCPLPVLVMWTPRPVANVHKGTYKSLTHTHNACQICTEYVN